MATISCLVNDNISIWVFLYISDNVDNTAWKPSERFLVVKLKSKNNLKKHLIYVFLFFLNEILKYLF